MKKTVSFSKHSKNVFFHILTQCNLKCGHCYINPEAHGKTMLTRETLESWLKIFSTESQSSNVIFLGGEPTLHPDLPFAVKKAKELGYASITIDTNGYLFNDILHKISPDELDYISFSLDGASRQTNDRIRGTGSYDKCTENMERAALQGFRTSLIYTVSRDNMHELEQMIPFLERCRADRFFIQVIGLRGRAATDGAGEKGKQLSYKEWMRIVPDVAAEVAKLGITVTWPKVFLRHDEPFECAGLVAENYFVFPNGRVYQCPLCEDFPLHSGIIRDDVLKKMPKINESDLFRLTIPEGCVMNKLIQPGNITYKGNNLPEYKIACCLLKEEIRGAGR